MARIGKKLGKYRIGKRLGQGGFATVYEARDTVEDRDVALKIPHASAHDPEFREAIRRELRIASRLDHPNILPPRNAEIIGDHFVVAFPLGRETLGDRMRRRMSPQSALDVAFQLLEGLAHAHERGVIHCDVKPENFVVFDDGSIKLTDFGISKVAFGTIRASGSGTIGYLAPEQAMGRPSFRSDVFSMALVLWRLFSRELPEWPFEQPLPGRNIIKQRYGEATVEVLERSLDLEPKRRYHNARLLRDALRRAGRKQRPRGRATAPRERVRNDWRTVRRSQFRREHGRDLGADQACARCAEPVSEAMIVCPWCGADRKRLEKAATDRSSSCPRCRRGVRQDWRFCPCCWGGRISESEGPRFPLPEGAPRCSCRRPLPPFARYCPWCHAKVKRRWTWPGAEARCRGCGNGALPSWWRHCPWCGRPQGDRP